MIFQRKGTSHGFMMAQLLPTLTGGRVNLITAIITRIAWQHGEELLLATGMTTFAMHGINTSARKMLVSDFSWIAFAASNH